MTCPFALTVMTGGGAEIAVFAPRPASISPLVDQIRMLPPSAAKMRDVLEILKAWAPKLEVEGEMHSDAALSTFIREEIFPNSKLNGAANLLIMPDLDAANIAFNLLKVVSGAVALGPILLGAAKAVHIVTSTATVRRLVNMTALAVVDAGAARGNLALPF